MSKIAIVLELTMREARALSCLAMDAVEWSGSGEFGDDICSVYMALVRLAPEADYEVAPHSFPRDRVWKKNVKA